MSSRKTLSPWNILYFVVGLFILYFLLKQINFHNLVQLILQVDISYFLLGGVLYLCKSLMRALRFKRINRRYSPRFLEMLRMTLATSVASQVLPMKLGELSYVYLMRKQESASISYGLSSLIVIRLIDMLTISLLFVVITLIIHPAINLSIYFQSVTWFMALLLVIIFGLLVLSAFKRANLQFLQHIPLVERLPLLKKLAIGADNFLTNLKQYTILEYIEWTGIASIEWMINYFIFYVIMLGLGLAPTFFDVVVSITFASLASVLPINSIGNFGTQEAGWATALILLGYPKEVAIASGFATHLLTLAYMLFFGGIAWLTYITERHPRG
jgi:glycosyltransferase 2 family protein